MPNRLNEVCRRRSQDAKNDIHQHTFGSTSEHLGEPARQAADYNGRDPTNSIVVHCSSP
jgi:hypothetical protein